MNSVPLYIIGIFFAGAIALRIVSRLFNWELRRSDPKLYERVGRPGDSNVGWGDFKGQTRFLFFLLFGGYLKLKNTKLAILGAIQQAVLVGFLGYFVYVVVASYICDHC